MHQNLYQSLNEHQVYVANVDTAFETPIQNTLEWHWVDYLRDFLNPEKIFFAVYFTISAILTFR